MRRAIHLSLVSACICQALAHSGHEADGDEAEGSYMERHMATEHHIDSFDQLSFFNLHDLNRDGILDRKELEAIYGLHHETSREGSDDEEHHALKTEDILAKVLAVLDTNGDGVVTKREFLEAGTEALPNFEGVKGLGHHYNSEGEYYLHHEELYHNTEETQTDEAYTHPEDLKHFADHEQIEAEEEALALKAQGLPVSGEGEAAPAAAATPEDQHVLGGGAVAEAPPASAREAAGRAAAKKPKSAAELEREELRAASAEAAKRGPWGGMKRPVDNIDRLRANIPYKYRFGRERNYL